MKLHAIYGRPKQYTLGQEDTCILSFRYYPFPKQTLEKLLIHVCHTSILKTVWEKEKLLATSNFSFSQCFLPLCRTLHHLHENKNCCLQTLSVWKSPEFVVWRRVKPIKPILTLGYNLKSFCRGPLDEATCLIQ